MTTLTYTIPSNLWLSLNDRRHWAPSARATAALRILGRAVAAREHVGTPGPCHVAAFIGYPTVGRADPSNAAPTVKALIDGITDAGVWPDDDHTYVIGPTYLRDPATRKRGIHTVRLVLTPQDVLWLTEERSA